MIPAAAFELIPEIGGRHGTTRHLFCPRCKSWVWTQALGMDDYVNVRAPMMDDSRWAVPFVEMFTCEKLPWASMPAVHSYERFPPPGDYQWLMDDYRARNGG